MKKVIYPLTRLSIDLTYTCNLHCQHCRQGQSRETPRKELTFEEVCRTINEAAELGVFRLTLSGGEPTLREDFLDIALYALHSRVGRVFVSTNGLNFPKNYLDRLLPFRDRLSFKISVDGPPLYHDAFRGRQGAFFLTEQTIRRLVQSGFHVQINTTLTRWNLPYLSGLLHWSASLGCKRHNIVEIIPVGRATFSMMLTGEERKWAWQIVHETQSQFSPSEFQIIAKLPFSNGSKTGLRCLGGKEECGVLTDGSIVGCRLISHLVEGNIREVSLREVWRDPNRFLYFRTQDVERLSFPCRECQNKMECFGGCHAVAYAVKGDFFAPDPRCPYVQDAEKERSVC